MVLLTKDLLLCMRRGGYYNSFIAAGRRHAGLRRAVSRVDLGLHQTRAPMRWPLLVGLTVCGARKHTLDFSEPAQPSVTAVADTPGSAVAPGWAGATIAFFNDVAVSELLSCPCTVVEEHHHASSFELAFTFDQLNSWQTPDRGEFESMRISVGMGESSQIGGIIRCWNGAITRAEVLDDRSIAVTFREPFLITGRAGCEVEGVRSRDEPLTIALDGNECAAAPAPPPTHFVACADVSVSFRNAGGAQQQYASWLAQVEVGAWAPQRQIRLRCVPLSRTPGRF